MKQKKRGVNDDGNGKLHACALITFLCYFVLFLLCSVFVLNVNE